MGGFNSGRRGGHPVVEHGLTLDLYHLIRGGSLLPGLRRAGSLCWRDTRTGETNGTISYEADLCSASAASMRLDYVVTRHGTKRALSYEVGLLTTAAPFGGRRWWFVCPGTGKLVTKLHLPPGGDVFASREAYRLAYQSQRSGPLDRSHNRQHRIYSRLGVEYRTFEQGWPRRKKGMHRKTYARLLEQLGAAEERHDAIFVAGSSRLLARLTRTRRGGDGVT